MANFESLSKSVVSGKVAEVKEQTKAMVDAGVNPLEIINKGLIGGMDIVAPLFKNGDMYVPEVLMAAKALAAGIEIVKPLIADSDMRSAGKVLIGTIKGDMHDIGKNLVVLMLESGGFTVINLGIDVAADEFIAAIKEHNPDIVAMSALLTTTMLNMKGAIALIKREGFKVKCIIGGAPISQEFADEIGADGYAPDAAAATDLCKKLLGV